MSTCSRCNSRNVDVYRFQLPSELPAYLFMVMSKSVRGDIEKLLKRYSAVELIICVDCGYAEIRFVARS